MSTDVGRIDLGLRAVLGLVLLGIAVFGGHWWGWIGVLPLVTAGFCPASKLIGRSTCPIAPKRA